jgi:hypothetical protein
MCFSMQWIAQLLIWAIAIGAAFAILNIIVPFVLAKVGVSIASEAVSILIRVLKIVLWAVVCIVLVIICFDLISCLIGMGGGLPRLHG